MSRRHQTALTAKPASRPTASPPTVLFGQSPQIRSGIQSGGQALDRHTLARMSARFGHDFSDVRIHTDTRAGASAAALGANAFALGPDVVFGAGRWTPGSPETERLLAHELTHVVQQDRWGVGDWGRASRREDASEREADGLASEVVAGRSVDVGAAPDAALARDGSDDQRGDPEGLMWNPLIAEPANLPPGGSPNYSPFTGPATAAPTPVYGPQPRPALPAVPAPVYGPQLRPTDAAAGPGPFPTSRPDIDPADVSSALDPDDISSPRAGDDDSLQDYPWGLPPHSQGGEKPGDVSGPYSFWSDDPDNTHNEASLYHGHEKDANGDENTTDIVYGNADSGTFQDDKGAKRYGVRANVGLYNATERSGNGSVNVQAATAGGEFSVGRGGFAANVGATAGGATITAKDDHSSASFGVSAGPQLGVGFQCRDREDDLYDGLTECCFSEQAGFFNGQFCADGDAVFKESPEDQIERAKIKAYDRQYAEKVKAEHDEKAEKEVEAQQLAYVHATPEQRKSLPHSWRDDFVAAVSDKTFAQTPPADPVCRADEPSCPAPLPSEAPPAAAPDPQASALAPDDEP